MNPMSRTTLVPCCLAVVLAAGVAAGSPATGECISADVPEAIRLPSGEVHPAGRLTLCVTRHFTPVATLHQTFVDGRSIGLLQSRRGESEGASDRPFMIFNRDPEGRLNLFGYATPAGSRMATYRLDARREASGSASPMARGAAAGAGNLVLMAGHAEPR